MRAVEVLRTRGIELSDEAFAALLEDALSDAGPAMADDPGRVLTPAEVAILTEGGAALEPLRGPSGAAGPPGETPPLAEAAAAYGALLASSLTVAQAAARLGVDPSRIRHRLADRSLYGIRLRSGWRLPALQFGPDGEVLPGVDVVVAALPADLHPLAVVRWLSAPLPELVVAASPVSPLAWLAGGGDPRVVAEVAVDL